MTPSSIGGTLAANVHGRGLTMQPFVSNIESFTGVEKAGHPLLFIQVFARNIILRHLMRADFVLISVRGVFHAVDAANSIRVFGGWTLQIQMGPFQV